jgi:hypothetical protein
MALVFTSCGPSTSDAIKFNDKIMDMIDNLKGNHSAFIDQLDGHNMDSLKLVHKQFSDNATSSLEASKKLSPFDEKNEFGNAAVDYFTALNTMANTQGKQIIEIMSKDSTQITQQDLDNVTALSEKFDATYDKAYDKIQAAQIKFSKEWKFDLIEQKEAK